MPPLFQNGRPLAIVLALLAIATQYVLANVEKTIFMGPAAANIPLAKPSLPDLNLHTLTPSNWSIRTDLARAFPVQSTLGQTSWVLLDGLSEGQRYEFRVCWAASEPTSFELDTYELDTVWDTPALIQSLAEYSSLRLEGGADDRGSKVNASPHGADGERKSSVLLLRIIAAADYFIDSSELMRKPPPVLVDLILDPYLYNVVPQSLLPTAVYIVILAVVTWFVAQWIATSLLAYARSNDEDKVKKIN